MSIMRVFSGSCLSLDDHDYSMPRVVARKHVLGSGEDLFDEHGRPFQPQPRTLTKVFSGSALDLNAAGDSDSDPTSQGISPAAMAQDHRVNNTQQSFNDFLDNHVDHRGARVAVGGQSRTMVLVIGGAGYLASHVIERLLREGFQVRATVSDMRNNAKLHDLYCMVPEAKHMLFIVEANIFNAASLRAAMANCRFVIHCGVTQSSTNSTDVVDSHMQAVMALFDAVRSLDGKSSRIERVVLTGSYTNVLSSTKSRAPTSSGLYDESQWNDCVTRTSDALTFARVSFEKEARRLATGHVELVVILPAIMIGPTRTTEVSEAMRTITDFAIGSPYFPVAPNISWNFVDVRDVAEAHVKALTVADAAGKRFVVTHSALCLAHLGRHIRKHFPHLTAPTYTAPTVVSLAIGPLGHSRASFSYLWRTLGVRRVLDGSSAINTLGLTLTPIDDTVRDAVIDLIQGGHLPESRQKIQPDASEGRLLLRASAFALIAGVAAVWWVRRK